MTRIAYASAISNAVISSHFDDAIRITEDYSVVEGNTIVDPWDAKLYAQAHRDGIQLIPTRDSRHNAQFAAAVQRGVTIRNNRISSGNQLQCIFSSDGLHENLTIENNILDTQGQHYITISGLLSGCIRNNRNANGELCPIRLEPLRIGGNNGTGNVWVVSFKAGTPYDYAPIESIVDDVALNHVIDHRQGHGEPLKHGAYLTDFDVDGFYSASITKQHAPHELQLLALSFGNFASSA